MMKAIINGISAIAALSAFFSLMYTVPKAIIVTSQISVRAALLNIFFLVWFTIMFQGTVKE